MDNKVEKQLEELEVETEDQIEADHLDDQDEDAENLEGSEEEEVDDSEDSEADEDSDNDDSEVTVTIGDEESPASEEQGLPKHLRKVIRDKEKQIRELKKQTREFQEKIESTTANVPVELGKKPTLEDLDYDSDRYDTELQKWYERKVEVDKQNAKVQEEQKAQEQQWQERLNTYNEAKKKLKVVDYEEAEFVAQDSLSQTQQGMIVEGADNPALLMYALGKNPKKLKELSSIKQPVKFAFAVSKLETQLKVASKKRPVSNPEKKIRSSSGSANAVDSTLEKLRDEAAKTGDFSKVMQYKNQLKNKK